MTTIMFIVRKHLKPSIQVDILKRLDKIFKNLTY